MAAKILKTVTSRWFLTFIGLLLLSALIWFAGPFIAIAGRAVLGGVVVRLVVILVLFVIWGAYNLLKAQAAIRRNNELVKSLAGEAEPEKAAPEPVADRAAEEKADIAMRLDSALGVLKTARFGEDGDRLYQLPWYVIIGPPGAGKTTALVNSGLRFPLREHGEGHAVKGEGGTRRCDWWFTDRAVLIDTAGRYTVQDSDAERDAAAWFGFLDLLKARRPRRPLNGVIVAVSATDLLCGNAEQRARHTAAIRARIEELNTRLGVSLPIYVVITKVDLLNGFTEYFENLDRDERAQVWGVTLAPDPKTPLAEAVATFERECDDLSNRLATRTLYRLHEESDVGRRTRIFSFPQQFADLRKEVGSFLRDTFEESRFRTKPFFRGAYFTSGVQEGAPIDRLLGALAEGFDGGRRADLVGKTTGKSFFINKLLTDVIFGEASLAGSDPAAERRLTRLRLAGVGAGALLLLVMAGVWTSAYFRNAKLLADLESELTGYAELASALPGAERKVDVATIEPALSRIRQAAFSPYAEEGRRTAGFSFGLGQDQRARVRLLAAYDAALEKAFLPRILARLEAQLQSTNFEPEQAFEALRIYLMAGRQGPVDSESILRWLDATWNADYPGGAREDLRKALAAHAQRLYGELGGPAHPVDDAIVKSMREIIQRQPRASLAYAQLRFDPVVSAMPDWSVFDHAGPQANLLFDRAAADASYGLRGMFTAKAYRDAINERMGALAENSSRDEWILGESAADSAIAGLRGQMREDIERLYFAGFVDAWRRHFNAVPIARPACKNSKGAVGSECLKQTADAIKIAVGPAEPLKTYIVEAAKAVDLSPNAAEGAVAGAIDGNDAAKRTGELAQSLGIAAAGDQPINLVRKEFSALLSFVAAPEGASSQLDQALGQLRDYANALDRAAAEFVDGEAKSAARALGDGIRRGAEHYPAPVSRIFNAFLSAGDSIVAGQSLAQINDAFAAGVGNECGAALRGRYPLDQSSSVNLLLGDFTRIFGPGGTLEAFFNANMRQYVVTASTPWTLSPEGEAIGLSPAGLRRFQTAEQIRKDFFPNGALGAKYTIEVVGLDPKASSVRLTVDGATVENAHTPSRPVPGGWPGAPGSQGVRIEFIRSSGGQAAKSWPGEWAIFRMLNESTIVSRAPADVTFEVAVEGMTARLRIRAESINNPFTSNALSRASCAGKL